MQVRDYSGKYQIRLAACTVDTSATYRGSSPSCESQENVNFELDVRLQQVSDNIPSQFSLNTQLQLSRSTSEGWNAEMNTASFKRGKRKLTNQLCSRSRILIIATTTVSCFQLLRTINLNRILLLLR